MAKRQARSLVEARELVIAVVVRCRMSVP